MPEELILSMKGISKSYPGVTVFEDFDFDLRRGEIHCGGNRIFNARNSRIRPGIAEERTVSEKLRAELALATAHPGWLFLAGRIRRGR
jgi:hypothetical protein